MKPTCLTSVISNPNGATRKIRGSLQMGRYLLGRKLVQGPQRRGMQPLQAVLRPGTEAGRSIPDHPPVLKGLLAHPLALPLAHPPAKRGRGPALDTRPAHRTPSCPCPSYRMLIWTRTDIQSAIRLLMLEVIARTPKDTVLQAVVRLLVQANVVLDRPVPGRDHLHHPHHLLSTNRPPPDAHHAEKERLTYRT